MTKNNFTKGHRNFVDIEIITRTFSGGMHGKDKYYRKQSCVQVLWKGQKPIITGKLEQFKKLSKCDGLEGQAIAATGMDSEQTGGLRRAACSATGMESQQAKGL